MKYLAFVLLVGLSYSAKAQHLAGFNARGGSESYAMNSTISPVVNRPFAQGSIGPLPGARMKGTGIGFMIGGPVLIIAGIALISSANTNLTTTNSYGVTTDTIDPKLTYGIVFAIEGTGLFIAGAILAAKGSKKLKAYQSQHKVSFNTRGAGAVLRVRF